jgi:chemotaxis protein histidine kinase CheA
MSFEPDEMMMQIFRSEVESHTEALTSCLLALEQDPTATATLDRLMRAAHSIKGAARIVRVNGAGDVAHAMEDCFVAAQKGRLRLKPDDVDILLRGVDLLAKISTATQRTDTDWTALTSSVQGTVAEVKQILDGGPTGTRADVSTGAPEPSRQAAPVEAPTERASAPARKRKRRPTAVISCPEILDGQAAEQVRRQLVSTLEAGSKEIQIDLSATRDLDATGLAFLAAARHFVATQAHATLLFQPVSTDMQTVLQLTGLDASASGAAKL